MELFSDEVQKIKSLLGEWSSHPEIEVEATFGVRGQVDMQTFLRVITRLKAKGYESISQQDRLTISLQDQKRFTLVGSGHITQYCNDNLIQGKPFVAIIKDRNLNIDRNTTDTIDCKDYNVRIKARREIELLETDPQVSEVIKPEVWIEQKKFFRLIRRWTFLAPGMKYDLSLVRSTKPDKSGYSWQKKFQDQPLMNYNPIYELEVELDRSTLGDKDPFKTFISGIGEILRGIQNCPILIRNSTKEEVLKQYKELTGTELFRGVNPVTLEVKNMSKDRSSGAPNIRDNYNVTDKADGLRVLGFTNDKGELFMIDMAMNVYRTGLAHPSCKNSLLDGEYITQKKDGSATEALLFFDIYFEADGKSISKKPFKADGECRYDDLTHWIDTWKQDTQKLLKSASLNVGMKSFYFATNEQSIFEQTKAILNANSIRVYNTDGVIFTANDAPLPDGAGEAFLKQFKWKPSEDNTVDFLVTTLKEEPNSTKDKITTEFHPVTKNLIQFKTLILHVGSKEEIAFNDARATILFELPLPGSYIGEKEVKSRYKAQPFVPSDFSDTQASICNLEVHVDPKTGEQYIMTERSEQPIRDLSIVEMRYEPRNPPGWRWIPIRVRTDKTERLFHGIKGREIDPKKALRLNLNRTLNSYRTAMSVWRSIHDPVTEYMITSGSDTPSPSEMAEMQESNQASVEARYYERKVLSSDKRKVKDIIDFHNVVIKDSILYKTIQKNVPSAKILDVAVGRGNDMHKWQRIGAEFVFGIDYAAKSIRDSEDCAYSRYLNMIIDNRALDKPLPIPKVFFAIGDSSMRMIDGSSGENDEERDIMRSIFGRVAPMGPVPPAVQKYGADQLKEKADVVLCMYAIHYFFESEQKFDGLLQNIADNLKVGGYFIGTNFDGQAVFDLLRNTEKGKSKVGMDKESILWEITKEYEADEFPNDSSAFGMAVDVNFISIGMTHREYLVPWNLLVRKMKSIGCEVFQEDMYEQTYDKVHQSGSKSRYTIHNPSSKEFSFLNRWYIFKRTSLGMGAEGILEDEGEAEEKINLEEMEEGAEGEGQREVTRRLRTVREIEGEGAEAEADVEGELEEEPKSVTNFMQSIKETEEKRKLIASQKGLTVPVESFAGKKVKFTADEVIQFYEKSIKTLKNLALPKEYESYAGRYLAPNAPFRIKDLTDTTDETEYPSITHFLAAMKFKYAADPSAKPIARIFSREGEIHQNWLASRLAAQKAQKSKVLTEAQHLEFVLNETTDVETSEIKYLNMKSTNFDESKWATVKDALLKSAIQQRITSDKRFCIIVNAALGQQKYLLYKNSSELGGSLTIGKGTIQGQNKYGNMIMQVAKEMPDKLRACMAV